MFAQTQKIQDLPMLDEAFLAPLAGHVGQSVLAELAADGLIELTDRLDRLQELRGDGAAEALRRYLHGLSTDG